MANDNNDSKVLTVDHLPIIKAYIDKNMQTTFDNVINEKLEENKQSNEDYLKGQLEEAKLSIEEQYKKDKLDLIKELEAQINAGNTAAVTELKLRLDALNADNAQMNDALEALGKSIDDTNSIFSQGQLNDLIKAAMINETTIDNDHIETPNMYAKNLVALIAKFGSVKAEHLTGDTIEGKTIRQYGEDSKWALNENGSGQLAGGKIKWDPDGNLTLEAKLEWEDIVDAQTYLDKALEGLSVEVKAYLQPFLDAERELSAEELAKLQAALEAAKQLTDERIDDVYDEIHNRIDTVEESGKNSVQSLTDDLKSAIAAASDKLGWESATIEKDFESCFDALFNAIAKAQTDGDETMTEQLRIVQEELNHQLESYKARIDQQETALGELNTDVEHIHSQALTSEGLANLLNTVLIDATKIDAESVQTPRLLARNLTALVAEFGTVNASNIVGTNIQGYTMSSPLYKKNAIGEYIYEKDENGNPVYEEDLDADGNIQYVKILDENGNPKLDENGNIQYELDENGNKKIKYKYELVLDKDGKPIYVKKQKKYTIPLRPEDAKDGEECAAWVLAADGSGHLAKGKISWKANGDITLGEGVTLKWGQVEEKPDIIGEFTSTAFTRTNVDISLLQPTGGTDETPIPNDSIFTENPNSNEPVNHTIKWTDHIPDGDAMLWASTRKFGGTSYDSKTNAIVSASETSTWSCPQKMTDTASFDVEFSKVVDNPGNPTDNKNNWGNDSDKDTVWMATRTVKNGVFGDWNISKIKGENGKSAEQLFVSNTFDQVYVDENGVILNGDQNISTDVVYMIGDAKQDNNVENKTFAIAYHVEYSYIDVDNNRADRFVSEYYDEAIDNNSWQMSVKDLFELGKGQIPTSSFDNIKLTSDILVVFDVDNDTTDYLDKFEPSLSKTLVLKRIQSNTDYDLSVSDMVLTKKFDTTTGNPVYTPEKIYIDVYSKKIGIDAGNTTSKPISKLDQMPKGMSIEVTYINGETPTAIDYTSDGEMTLPLEVNTILSSNGTDTNGNTTIVISTISKIELHNTILNNDILFDEVVPTIVSDGKDGADGISSFISYVYTVSTTQPNNPEGGSYDNPEPNEVDGKKVWIDGIPAVVNGPLWCSQRVFYSDNSGNTLWSKPMLLSDTDTFQVEYGVDNAKQSLTNFGNYYNAANGDINAAESAWRSDHYGWSDNTNDAKYMATCSKIAGTNNWSNWVVTQIKGERGEDGADAPTVFIAYAYKRSYDDLTTITPTGGTIKDPIPTSKINNDDCPWSDGAISEKYHPGILWQTRRRFDSSVDNYNDQDSIKWEAPVIVSDNETTQTVYGTIEAKVNALPILSNPEYKSMTSEQIGDLFDNIDNWDDEPVTDTEYYYTAVAKCKNGKWGDWLVSKIKGENGDPIFVAYAFMRSDDNVAKPANDIYTTETTINGEKSTIILPNIQWQDSIPTSGVGKVWMTKAVIKRTKIDDKYTYVFDDKSGWSEPVVMVDTEYQEIIYGVKETGGKIDVAPATYVQNKLAQAISGWDDEPQGTTDYWYMAVAKYKNGAWGNWMVSKIKGEDGAPGAPGAPGADGKDGQDGRSINIAGSFETALALNTAYPTGPKTPSGNIDFSCGFIVTYDDKGQPLGELFMWLLGANNIYAWTSVGKVQGPQGPDGKTAYIHIKYAKSVDINTDGSINKYVFTDPVGDLKEGEAVGPYQGIYTDYNVDDSLNWKDYTWSFIDSVEAVKTQLGEYHISSTLIEGHTIQCDVTTLQNNNTSNVLVTGTQYDTFDPKTGALTSNTATGSEAGPVWQLSSQGYGYLAGGNIRWDADGDVYFGENVTLNWNNIKDADGKITTAISNHKVTAEQLEGQTITGATIKSKDDKWELNSNGNGYLGNFDGVKSIEWDANGVTIQGENVEIAGNVNINGQAILDGVKTSSESTQNEFAELVADHIDVESLVADYIDAAEIKTDVLETKSSGERVHIADNYIKCITANDNKSILKVSSDQVSNVFNKELLQDLLKPVITSNDIGYLRYKAVPQTVVNGGTGAFGAYDFNTKLTTDGYAIATKSGVLTSGDISCIKLGDYFKEINEDTNSKYNLSTNDDKDNCMLIGYANAGDTIKFRTKLDLWETSAVFTNGAKLTANETTRRIPNNKWFITRETTNPSLGTQKFTIMDELGGGTVPVTGSKYGVYTLPTYGGYVIIYRGETKDDEFKPIAMWSITDNFENSVDNTHYKYAEHYGFTVDTDGYYGIGFIMLNGLFNYDYNYSVTSSGKLNKYLRCNFDTTIERSSINNYYTEICGNGFVTINGKSTMLVNDDNILLSSIYGKNDEDTQYKFSTVSVSNDGVVITTDNNTMLYVDTDGITMLAPAISEDDGTDYRGLRVNKDGVYICTGKGENENWQDSWGKISVETISVTTNDTASNKNVLTVTYGTGASENWGTQLPNNFENNMFDKNI